MRKWSSCFFWWFFLGPIKKLTNWQKIVFHQLIFSSTENLIICRKKITEIRINYSLPISMLITAVTQKKNQKKILKRPKNSPKCCVCSCSYSQLSDHGWWLRWSGSQNERQIYFKKHTSKNPANSILWIHQHLVLSVISQW